MTETPLDWRRETPAAPGYFWLRLTEYGNPTIVVVTAMEGRYRYWDPARNIGTWCDECQGAHWAGPLEPPPARPRT